MFERVFLLTFSTIYPDVGWMGESEKFQQYADVIYGWPLTHIFLTQFGNKIA